MQSHSSSSFFLLLLFLLQDFLDLCRARWTLNTVCLTVSHSLSHRHSLTLCSVQSLRNLLSFLPAQCNLRTTEVCRPNAPGLTARSEACYDPQCISRLRRYLGRHKACQFHEGLVAFPGVFCVFSCADFCMFLNMNVNTQIHIYIYIHINIYIYICIYE